MNTSRITAVTYGKAFVLWVVALTALAFGPFIATAQQNELAITGSSGIVDEQFLANYEVRNQFATIKSGVTGTVDYRFNLPATADFQDCPACAMRIRIRYRDPGAGAHIFVQVIAVNTNTGGTTIIYDFDSDGPDSGATPAPPNSTANQTVDRTVTVSAQHINHGLFGYYLYVSINKTGATPVDPGIVGFVISDSPID